MADTPRTKPSGKQPISRHPLFPATVALWFGALFGLGSLLIGTQPLEALVMLLGLDALVPAMAPPLGSTARLLVAIVTAGIGGLIGGVLAYKLGRPKAAAAQRKRGADAFGDADKPKHVYSDLGKDSVVAGAEDSAGFEEPADPPRAQRRRLVATGEDLRRPDEQERVSSPILDVAEFGMEGFGPDTSNQQPSRDEQLPRDRASQDALIEEPRDAETDEAPTLRDEAISDTDDAGPADGGSPPTSRLFDSYAQNIATPSDSITRTPAAERIASAELSELSPIELLERLAISIERRRRRRLELAAVEVDESAHEEALPEQEEAPPQYAAPTGIPAALRPINLADDLEDEDEILPNFVPPRHIGASSGSGPAQKPPGPGFTTRIAQDDEDESGDDSRTLEEGYSSLLNLSRSSPEPVVAFPHQLARQAGAAAEPAADRAASTARPFDPPQDQDRGTAKDPDREDTERALRDALANLQRISGVG